MGQVFQGSNRLCQFEVSNRTKDHILFSTLIDFQTIELGF